MAVEHATYHLSDGKVLTDTYIRITRIWGSKEEGWNAWVAVYENPEDTTHKDMFHVHADYKDGENPFKLLYQKVEELPNIVKAKLESPGVSVYEKDINIGVSSVKPEPPKSRVIKEDDTAEFKKDRKVRTKK